MSIADYNNNPGNLKPPKGMTYEGQIGVDDRGFAIFENKEFGRKALIGDIQAKIEKGIVTPEDFVNRYAPAGSENEEAARNNYKIFIAEQLGLKSTKDKFTPESADKLADAIAHFESGTRPEQTEATRKKEADFSAEKMPTSKETGKEEEPPLPAYVGAGVGGVGGGIAGTTAAITKAKIDAGKEAYDILKSKIAPGGPPPTLAESSLIPSEAQHTRAFEGTKKDAGVTGRASQTTYNLRTQQIAEEAAEKKRVLEQLRRANILSKSAPNIPGIVASTPAGIIAPTEAVQGLEAAAQPATAVASKSSPLWAYARRLMGLPVKGALYGAGIGFGAADAYNRARAGENQEAVIGGLGTAAGLASTFVPAMTTAGVLPAAAVAAPLYLAASDRLRRLQKHPEEYQLQEDEFDPLGNRLR